MSTNTGTRYALTSAIIVSLGGFVFGFDASVISGVVGFVTAEFSLTPLQTGFVVAGPTLGAAIAAPVAGPMSDRFGRKQVLIFIAFLYLVSAFFSALATSYAMLVGARFVGGLAFASLMIAPMYIGEISPPQLRGRRVSLNQLNIVIGLSVAYFTNYVLLKFSGLDAPWVASMGLDTNTWRWMLGLEIVPALIFFLALFAIPNSPRWLLLKGRVEDARLVLGKLFTAAGALEQFDAIRRSSAQTRESLWQRLADVVGPKMRLALVVGLIVGVAQQITGVNAIYFYAPTIFEQSGIGKDAAFAQAVWVGIINIVFTLVAMALIDRWGRRPLLLTGLAGVALSMAICTYGFSTATYQWSRVDAQQLSTELSLPALDVIADQQYDSDIAFKAALSTVLDDQALREHESTLIKAAIKINPVLILIGILGFVASFAVSLGPVMWVLFSEIFPNQLRGVAISLVGFVNSAVSFGVQLLFPLELSVLGAATTFLIYGVFAVLGLVLVWRLLPETGNRSLEELEHVFGDKSAAVSA